MEKIKKMIMDLAKNHGRKIGIFMFKNCGIAAAARVALFLLVGTDFTLLAAFEIILAVPLIAVVSMLTWGAVKLFHRVIPMYPGLGRLVIDFVIFFVILMAFSYFMESISGFGNNLVQYIITAVFDILYVGLAAWFMIAAKKNETDFT